MNEPGHSESALFGAMTLLAVVSAAAEAAFGMRERRAGRDPSTQEDEAVAIPALLDDAARAQEILLQLRTSLIVGAEDEPAGIAGRVRRFGELQQLRRLGRLFQRIHQRLLSLYPDVPESLVETARAHWLACGRLIEAGGGNAYQTDAPLFVERCMRFSIRLRRVVSAIRKAS